MNRIKKVQNLKQQGKGGSHAYKMATIVSLACESKVSSFSKGSWTVCLMFEKHDFRPTANFGLFFNQTQNFSMSQ